jgi:hypothetical protein
LNRYQPGLVLACFLVAAGVAPAVRAQSLQQQVRACRTETDDARRLSCYDRAAATLDKSAAPSAPSARAAPATVNAPKAPANVVAPASAPASSAAAEFGVSEGPLAAKRQATGLKQITAVVTSVSVRPRGELLMTLDNGQVWQQNQAVEYFPLNVGDTVKISSAALGSYLLLTPAKRTTKVTRVR